MSDGKPKAQILERFLPGLKEGFVLVPEDQVPPHVKKKAQRDWKDVKNHLVSLIRGSKIDARFYVSKVTKSLDPEWDYDLMLPKGLVQMVVEVLEVEREKIVQAVAEKKRQGEEVSKQDVIDEAKVRLEAGKTEPDTE
tara:strand:- start:133 stop:546 length:414 start_codon:yes stop_codon:yes gene_type:complete